MDLIEQEEFSDQQQRILAATIYHRLAEMGGSRSICSTFIPTILCTSTILDAPLSHRSLVIILAHE